MPLFFLGTREWRNRQTRTVQVRVPVMEWGFNSPLAHDETADPFGICGFCFPWLLLAAPWVFRAPRVLCEAGLLAGPGRCVCRWAAARPRDRHTRAALGVVDLEARPGPATAHRHRGQAPRFAAHPCPPDPPAPFTPVGPGVPACRTPNDANSPFGGREFVAWRARVRVSGLTCAISPMRAEAVPW